MLLPSLLNQCSPLHFAISLFFYSARLEGSVAAVSNRTIDDEFGDEVTGLKPVFLPNLFHTWQGEECLCPVSPDKTKAFKQTYNAATYNPEFGTVSIGLKFKGTAIYVFFTIANTVNGGKDTTLTECNFTIDGVHAGYYRHDPTPDTNFLYQVPVFKGENLQNMDHFLNISTSGLDYHTFTNFDYAIYTFDDSPAAPPSMKSLAPPTTNQFPAGTSTDGAGTPNSTTANTNMHPPNGTTTESGPMVVSPVTAASPQGGTQDPSATTSLATRVPNPASSNVPDGQSSPMGTIAGGSAGGVALILLVLLLFVLYRRKKRIDRAKLTAATAAPGSGIAVATPFMMAPDYSSRYPNAMSATAKSSTAPIMVQRINSAARNPKFPPGVDIDIDPFRDHRVRAVVNSLESGGGRIRRVGEGENPVRHLNRRKRREITRNSGSSSRAGHERSLAYGGGPSAGVVTVSAEAGHVGGDEGGEGGVVIDAPTPTQSSEDVDARRRSQIPLGADLDSRQLREVQGGTLGLGVRISHPRSRDSLVGVAQMREQMQLMQEQILYMQHLQGSAGPPPEYTTAITERGVEGV